MIVPVPTDVQVPPRAALASQPGDPAARAASAAAAGALAGVYVGAYMLPVLLLLLSPAAIVAGGISLGALLGGSAATGAAIGGLAGLGSGLPPSEAAAWVRSIDDTFVSEFRTPSTTAAELAKSIPQWTPYRAEVLEVADPGALSKQPYVGALRQRGVGALVEVRIRNVGYVVLPGEAPGIALHLSAEARLVDVSAGRMAARRGLVYQSPSHPPDAWAKDDYALAKVERDKARRTIADRIVDDLLLGVDAAGPVSPPAARACGPVPLDPKVEWERGAHPGERPRPAAVDTVTPALAWEATPSDESPPASRSWTEAEGRRYDLRIWNEIDGTPGELVYERVGLGEPAHHVETPLAPGAKHYWSVRMRYTLDGHPRATHWSAATQPAFALPPPLRDALFQVRANAGEAWPARCDVVALDPCGCLDFIPAPNHFTFRTP